MLVILVEFDLDPSRVESFRERVKRQARDTLELETDCEVFDVCIDPANPCRVLLYEVYRDQAAFDAHLASTHFLDFDATVADWVRSKTVTRLERI